MSYIYSAAQLLLFTALPFVSIISQCNLSLVNGFFLTRFVCGNEALILLTTYTQILGVMCLSTVYFFAAL